MDQEYLESCQSDSRYTTAASPPLSKHCQQAHEINSLQKISELSEPTKKQEFSRNNPWRNSERTWVEPLRTQDSPYEKKTSGEPLWFRSMMTAKDVSSRCGTMDYQSLCQRGNPPRYVLITTNRGRLPRTLPKMMQWRLEGRWSHAIWHMWIQSKQSFRKQGESVRHKAWLIKATWQESQLTDHPD